MSRGTYLFVLIALLGGVMGMADLCIVADRQTALLQQIAAQTRQPVSIEVSGFSPEAQQVFSDALQQSAPRDYKKRKPRI